MNIQPSQYQIPSMVKLGASRQIAIPKRLWHLLRLRSGEYMQIKQRGKGLFLTPQIFVDKDKDLEADLAESFQDLKEGRSYGPFDTWEAFIASLHKEAAKIRKERKNMR